MDERLHSRLVRDIRELIQDATIEEDYTEEAACSLARDVLLDLDSEFKMRLDELDAERGYHHD